MADYQTSDQSTIIDLQIQNLLKEKEILSLKERISELEGRQTSTADFPQPSFLVTNVTPSGQIQLDVCDTATPNVLYERETAPRSPGTDPRPPKDSRPPPTDQREGKIVRIEAKKHANSFHFKKRDEKRDEWMRNLTGEVTDLYDEMRRRNCLAKAIKQNCVEITKNVYMQDGIFLDQLLSVACLDDEERKLVSESRKGEANQMRAIIVIVLKKDFSTILALVSCIRENNRDPAENIICSYKELVSSEFGKEEKCWWCLLRTRVKFAVLVDKLLSKDLIDEELYMEASREDLSPGKRQEIWIELSKQLVSHGNTRDTMECLRVAIDNSGVHHDIVSMISLEIDKNFYFLQCKCGPQMQMLKISQYETDKDGDSGRNTFVQSARVNEGEGQILNDDDKSSGFGAS